MIDIETFAPQATSSTMLLSPNDTALAKHLAGTDRYFSNGTNKKILGGVCDAHAAASAGLTVHAAIVRRLAFAIVAPRNIQIKLNTFSSVKSISAHGNQMCSTAERCRPSSSAQALASFLAHHFTDPGKTIIKGVDYRTSPKPRDKCSLVISANIPSLFEIASDSNYSIYSAADIFPELSSLTLSTFALPRSLTQNNSEHNALLTSLFEAVHTACWHLRSYPDDEGLVKALRLHYGQQIPTDEMGRWVADWLVGNRVIPGDAELNEYGFLLSKALWKTPKALSLKLLAAKKRFAFSSNGTLTGYKIVSDRVRDAKQKASRSVFDRNIHARIASSLNSSSVDVVILCPTEGEYEAHKNHFKNGHLYKPRNNNGAQEYIFTFGDKRQGIIASMNDQMGRVAAATTTMRLLPRWRPRVVILSGIAGGFKRKGAKLGSLLIAGKGIDYELQKINTTRNRIDYEIFSFDAGLVNEAKHVHTLDWDSAIGVDRPVRPKTLKPELKSEGEKILVLSGDKIFANPHIAQSHLKIWQRAVGVEMEAAGVAGALRALESEDGKTYLPRFLMIRAVSDFASKDKSDKARHKSKNGAAWRHYACHVAAAFTSRFVMEHFSHTGD